MVSIAVLIVVLVTIGYYKLGINVSELSTVLDSVIWYIWCRQNPQSPVVIFGLFSIPGAYVPWCLTVMHALMQIDFAQQVYASLLLEASAVRLAVYLPFLWNELVNYSVGHFWWFSRDFLLANVYFDSNEQRRKIAWSETRRVQREYAGRGPVSTSDLLRLFMLPPWYWGILSRVEAMPENENRNEQNGRNEQSENGQSEQNEQSEQSGQNEQNELNENEQNEQNEQNEDNENAAQ
jgi:Derlin-2/3